MRNRDKMMGLSDAFIVKLAKHILSQEAGNIMQDLDIGLATVKRQLDSSEWVPLEGSGNRMVRSVSLGYVGEGLSEQAAHELFWRAQEMGFDMRVEDDGELVAFEIAEDPSKFVLI